MFKENNRFLIKTPTGFEKFKGVYCKNINILYKFQFQDKSYIECSGGHKFLTDEGFLEARLIKKENTICNKKIINISQEKGIFKVYEPISVENNQTYITNEIISHNCDFLGSTNTLISGEKLATLAYKNPINKYSDAIIYEEPIKETYDEETGEQISKDNTYVICVDVSEGKNLDYSAFSVVNISTMPYRQVAIYRNNSIPPMLFPTIIKAVAQYYNNAFVLIEINNTPQIADLLLEDLEYDNVLQVSSGNKKAQTVTINRGGKNVARGVKMSPLVKRMGCSTIKTLVENDKLILNDFETISEFTTFVVNGPSFSAEEGCNDDLAMTLVIFGWLVTQKFFKEMVEIDIRKQLQMEHFNYIEEEQLPMGEISTGREISHFVEDGAVWVESIYTDPYGDILKNLLDF